MAGLKVGDYVEATVDIPFSKDEKGTWVVPAGNGGEVVTVDDHGVTVAFGNMGLIITRDDWTGLVDPAPVANEPAAVDLQAAAERETTAPVAQSIGDYMEHYKAELESALKELRAVKAERDALQAERDALAAVGKAEGCE